MPFPKSIVLIPARYGSKRFPGKPLHIIDGKTMISRTYSNFSESGCDCCVVTDDQRIEDHIKEFGGQVCRVDDDVSSGTLRIFLAFERFFKDKGKKYDFVINVQGDEPLLKYSVVEKLIKFHHENSFDITTLVIKNSLEGDFKNPNKVKVVFSKETGKCFYFSRSPIPYQEKIDSFYSHIGVYCFKPESLKKYCESSVSYYEKVENLEQLRALENGLSIGAMEIEEKLLGVDSPEDVKAVKDHLKGCK